MRGSPRSTASPRSRHRRRQCRPRWAPRSCRCSASTAPPSRATVRARRPSLGRSGPARRPGSMFAHGEWVRGSAPGGLIARAPRPVAPRRQHVQRQHVDGRVVQPNQRLQREQPCAVGAVPGRLLLVHAHAGGRAQRPLRQPGAGGRVQLLAEVGQRRGQRPVYVPRVAVARASPPPPSPPHHRRDAAVGGTAV